MYAIMYAKRGQTKREKDYCKIRKTIMFGTLKLGEKLAGRHLCEMLELERAPIREAIGQLESEGFLREVPNRGPMS